MIRLTPATLDKLKERLRARGERASVVLGSAKTSLDAIEAMNVVTEYGALCEAMFLVMLADKKVKNVERDVLRGAMRVLSNDRVRSTHLESMLDAAARGVAEEGLEKRLAAVIERLRGDEGRAETVYVLAAAVAAADAEIVPEESAVLHALAEGLGLDEHRANRLLAEIESGDVLPIDAPKKD